MPKNLTLASLTLNLVLVAALVWSLQRHEGIAPSSEAAGGENVGKPSVSDPSGLQLQSRLADLGLEDQKVRQIVSAAFRSGGISPARIEYWKPSFVAAGQRTLARYDDLKAVRKAVVSSLGDKATADENLAPLFRPYEVELGFLPPEKQMALQEIEMENLRSSIAAASPVQSFDVWTAAASQIRALLSDSEWQEYQYRKSMLRERLLATGFDFAEEEYRRVFDAVSASKQNNMAFVGGVIGDPKRDPALATQLQQILGDERFQTFQKIQSPIYATLVHVGKSHNLSAETIDTAYELIARSPTSQPRVGQKLSSSQAQYPADLRKVLGSAAFEQFSKLTGSRDPNQMAVIRAVR